MKVMMYCKEPGCCGEYNKTRGMGSFSVLGTTHMHVTCCECGKSTQVSVTVVYKD